MRIIKILTLVALAAAAAGAGGAPSPRAAPARVPTAAPNTAAAAPPPAAQPASLAAGAVAGVGSTAGAPSAGGAGRRGGPPGAPAPAPGPGNDFPLPVPPTDSPFYPLFCLFFPEQCRGGPPPRPPPPPTPWPTQTPPPTSTPPATTPPATTPPATTPPATTPPATTPPATTPPVTTPPATTPPATTPPPTPPPPPSSDQTTILQLHNAARAKHGAPALSWDASAASFAASWVAKCNFQHSNSATYGENLCLGYTSWADCVNAWLDEEKQYDYTSPGFSEATGHFTQCVWKATTSVGCAAKACPDGTLYSCNYAPPGNVIGQFAQNVLPPTSTSG